MHAVSLLQNVIDNICENKFCPDAPRSEYFPKTVESRATGVGPSSLVEDWDGYTDRLEGEDVKQENHSFAGIVEVPDESSEDDLSASSDSAMSSASDGNGEEELDPAEACKVWQCAIK